MALKLVTPPATEPISLTEAKAHLRVDHNDDDATISFLITVARQYVDAISGWHGHALITQTWDLILDAFPLPTSSCCWPAAPVMTETVAALPLPYPPLQSVTSIKYIDSAGAQQTMPPADYAVDTISEPGWIIPVSSWPASKAVANAIEVRFVCGFGNAADVPATIRHALLLMIGHWYENREQVLAQYEGGATVLSLPLGVECLLFPTQLLRV